MKIHGTWKMCVDNRALNKVTIKDKFPIPIVEELLDIEVSGSKLFSKLDLTPNQSEAKGCAQNNLLHSYRHYKFLVISFGLTNAPSMFQSLINEVFKPFF